MRLDRYSGAAGELRTRMGLPSYVALLLFLLALVVAPSQGEREYLFTAQTKLTILLGPWDIKSSDLNGDGYLDIVTANRYSGSVTVALNNGNGGFDSIWSHAVGFKPWDVALGDLDGDDDTDIAVTLTDFEVADSSGGDYDVVALLFNDGRGSFSGLVKYPIGNNPRTISLADLGEDTNMDLDIITVNEETSSSLSILFNDGYGNFSATMNYSLGVEPRGMAVADFNQDGYPDIVTANKMSDNITILFNDRNGYLNNFTYIDVGSGPWDICSENVTGDSSPDIVVLNRYEGTVDILENDGGGNFSFNAKYNIGNNNSVRLEVGDADLDGYNDIMCSSMADDLLTILYYNVTSSSYQRSNRTIEGGPRGFVLADLDIGPQGRMNIAAVNVGDDAVTILVSDVPPTISILEPDGVDDFAEFEFRIEWEDEDPDSNAEVQIYYFRQNSPSSLTLLGTFSENDYIDFLVWNITSLEEGNYYIKAVISDDFSTAQDISDGPITVEFPESGRAEGGMPSSGLILIVMVGLALTIVFLYLVLRKKPQQPGSDRIEESGKEKRLSD